MTETLKFARMDDAQHVVLPAYQTDGAAGMDIAALEPYRLGAGEIAVLRTGLRVAVPDGWELQIRSRSGLAAKRAVHVLNSPATIDSDYRGELKIILHNASRWAYPIAGGERIAQLVLKRAPRLPIELVDESDLDETARGQGGLGSTGK